MSLGNIYTIKEYGNATDVDQLMLFLRNFIATNTNFTEVFFDDYKDGKHLVIQKSNIFYHFYSFKKNLPDGNVVKHDGIAMFISDGYTKDASFTDELYRLPIREYYVHILNGNIPHYGFFWNGENFIITTEYNNGFYSMSNFGSHTSVSNYSTNIISSNLTGYDRESDYSPLFNKYSGNINSKWLGGNEQHNGHLTTSSKKEGNFTFATETILSCSKTLLNNKSSLFFNCFYWQNGFTGDVNIFSSNTDFAFCSSEFLNAQEIFKIGEKEYIFYPFFEKENPIDYNNDKSLGMGIAIRIK